MEKELFLKVSKNRYFDNKDLSPIDMLILSQIEEFERNEKSCYMASKTFASNFNVSEETINRSIKKLVSMQYINSTLNNEHKDGKIQTTRQLSIVKKDMACQNDNTQDETSKNVSCQNDSQKDKLKENKKDNTIANQNEKDKYTSGGCPMPKIETEEIVLTYTPRKSLVSTMLGE